MPKHWKSFLPPEDDKHLGDELLANDASQSLPPKDDPEFESILKSNSNLKKLLEEREELEEKMNQLTGKSSAKPTSNKRFDNFIPSVTEKRKEENQWAKKREEKRQKFIQKKNQSVPKKKAEKVFPVQPTQPDWFSNNLSKKEKNWEEKRANNLDKIKQQKEVFDQKLTTSKTILEKTKELKEEHKKKKKESLSLQHLDRKIKDSKEDLISKSEKKISNKLDIQVEQKAQKKWDNILEKREKILDLEKKSKELFQNKLITSTPGNLLTAKEIIEEKKNFFSTEMKKKFPKKKEEEKPKEKPQKKKDSLKTDDKKPSSFLEKLKEKKANKKEKPQKKEEKKNQSKSTGLTTDDKKRNRFSWPRKKQKSEMDEWQMKRDNKKKNNDKFFSLHT